MKRIRRRIDTKDRGNLGQLTISSYLDTLAIDKSNSFPSMWLPFAFIQLSLPVFYNEKKTTQ